MKIVRIFFAAAGAALLLATFAFFTSEIATAQGPTYDVTAYYNSVEREPYEWYTVSNTFGIQFYSASPYTVTVEWEFVGSGGRTASFCSGSKAPSVYSNQSSGRWTHKNCTDWAGTFTGVSVSSGSGCTTGAAGSASDARTTLWAATCDPWTADAEGTTTLYANANNAEYYTLLGFSLPTGSYYAAQGTWNWRWYPSEPITQTEPTTGSLYCSGGTELISDTVELELGERWTAEEITEWPYLQARFTISNPWPAGEQHIYGTAYLNDSTYVWSPELYPHPVTSFTIPSAFRYDSGPNGPTATVALVNTGHTFEILSVCLLPYTQTVLPTGCNLVNYSFTDSSGWDYKDPTGTRLASEEDGAWLLDTGEWAAQMISKTGVFNLQVRARSYGDASTAFSFGSYASSIFGSDTVYTETATEDYSIYEGSVFIQRLGFGLDHAYIGLNAADDSIAVDWICLRGFDTSGLPYEFPITQCTFPDYSDHPDYSITEIGNWILWLATKFGQLLMWLLCEILNGLAFIANQILAALRSIGGFIGSPDWPDFPTEITFDTLIQWLAQCYKAFFAWLGMNFLRFRDAIPIIAEWWWNVIAGILGWIIDNLIGPILAWIMDHILEALGVGEDTRAAFMVMWRDWRIFLEAAWIEAGYEFGSLMTLLQETAGVFGVLIVGLRGVATGESELDFGEALGGLAGYLWRGVAFINEVITFTPLSALNIVALGIIAIGLAQWTVKKFVGMLERFS